MESGSTMVTLLTFAAPPDDGDATPPQRDLGWYDFTTSTCIRIADSSRAPIHEKIGLCNYNCTVTMHVRSRSPIFTAPGASGRPADQNIDQLPAARGGFGRSSAPGLPRARARLPVRCARAAATALSLSWPSARRPTGCLPVHGCIA